MLILISSSPDLVKFFTAQLLIRGLSVITGKLSEYELYTLVNVKKLNRLRIELRARDFK